MKLYLFMLSLLCSGLVSAQKEGVMRDQEVLKSKILGEDRKYAIYLPPAYDTSDINYPVVYLLHPAGPKGTIPNQQSWANYGELKDYLDNAIAKGEIAPMIVVTPDANFGTERISYFNDPDNAFNFEDYFFQEFIPYIEKTYRTRTDREGRAIAGASLGGGASTFFALHHPELFSVSCSLSGAIRGFDKAYLNTRYPGISDETLADWYAQYDVYELFKQEPNPAIAWYIACGDDDALSPNNALLHIELKKENIPHAFRMQAGKHDWAYWRTEMPKMFPFISSHLSK